MKRKILITIIAIIFLSINSTFANNFIDKTIDWYRFRVLWIDTRAEEFEFKVGVNLDHSATPLRDLLEKSNWISAVNWVFFCPADYKECWGQDFTENERYYQWYRIGPNNVTGNRVVFAIDKDGSPFIYQTDKINVWREHQIYYWLANFPLLLWNWESMYDEYEELWLIDYKMKAKMQRNFICHDETRRFIYTWYISAIELQKLPEVLKKFGCYNALNLDAWASSSLIYNWRQVLWPWRDILDGIVIERKWLDTSIIRENVDQALNKFRKKVSLQPYNSSLIIIDKVTEALDEMRIDMYEKYSFNTFWPDWKKNWYEIYVKDLEALTFLYTINYMNKELYYIRKELIAEEEARKLEQKKEKDAMDWLF